ncbi:hypothetical protein Tco_0335825, partial [Tanacetum coccineum]
FDFTSMKTASTPIKTQEHLTKDEEANDVDIHLYRSMISSLIYLTASRPDIMFAVCACSRFQVTPKTSHLNAVKRIFRGLISWHCKKQIIMATSTTEAEYVAAANCLWEIRRWTLDDMMMIWGSLYLFLRATYGAELVSAASLVNTARPKLSTARLVWIGFEGTKWKLTSWYCQAKLVLPGKVGAARHKVSAARQKFVLLVTVTTVVVVTEASIRSSLLLNDVVGTACLTNEAIFQNLAVMGYEDFNVDLNNQIELGEPFNDVYITPAHTLKVFSNMSRKGVKFSGKVTPLFDSMLVPHQAPEGEGSEQPTEPQPTPFPTQPSIGDQPPVTDSSSSHDTTQDSSDLRWELWSEGDQVQPSHDSHLSGGPTSDRAKGGMTLEELSILCTNLSNRVLALEAFKDAQAAEIIKLKTRIKNLKKKSHPVISHHRAWLRSVSRLSMKRKLGRKESVSKQGRKNAEPGSTLDDSTFDDLNADHGMDYMDTEEPVNKGRLRFSTTVPKVSTTTLMTPPTTTSVFEDEDMFLADALPLPSIDPKDKGKGVLKELPVKKVKRSDLDAAQIAKDAEVARLIYEEEQAELEREKEERQRQEQASVDYIANLYDEVQAKMDASEELAARLQIEEIEMYTVEERSRLLAEYFENKKKQLAEERSAAIRNIPPTRTQLRSLMMIYLKHT